MNATTQQLGLPFDFDVMHTWTDAVSPAPAGLEFTACLTERGARLKLVGPWPQEEEQPRGTGVVGVLWQAEIDMVDPSRTVIAPGPEHGLRISFATRLPFPDCFTAPMAWASVVGRRQGMGVEGLMMAMRRTLVAVARHLERLQVEAPDVAAAAGVAAAG
jgi:hypothetical protein